MTTRALLKASARKLLTGEMRRRGFAPTPRSFGYARQVNDIWHIVAPDIGRYSRRMDLIVTAWVPEWQLQPFDIGDLGKELLILTGGYLGKDRLGSSTMAETWSIETDDERQAAFRDMLILLDAISLPWLDKIRNRHDLVKHINKMSAVDRWGNRAADQVFGKNLLYREDAERMLAELDAKIRKR